MAKDSFYNKRKHYNKKNKVGSRFKYKNVLLVTIGLAILLLMSALISNKLMTSIKENNGIKATMDSDIEATTDDDIEATMDSGLKTTIKGGNSATSSAKITFPKDHAFHSAFKNEWWYLNLMVRSATTSNPKITKDTYYLISFSKINGTSGLLTSRYETGNNAFNQKTNYPGNLTAKINSSKLLTISYSNNKGISLALKELTPLKNGAKRYSLKGTTPEIGTIDLVLTERTVNRSGSNTPLLWGCNGNISVFAPNDTFYYSIPDLDITGKLTDIDKLSKKVVIGKAWMDHQWFNSVPSLDWKGHYWTSQYLTGRSDFSGPHISLGAVTQIYNNGPRYSYWVKRNINGTNECGSNLQITPASFYSNGYPSAIKLNLSDNQKKIFYKGQLNSFSSNQIFNIPTKSNFFEPASYITGNIKNIKYTGLGFFETSIKNK